MSLPAASRTDNLSFTTQNGTELTDLASTRHLNGQISPVTSDTGNATFDSSRSWAYQYDTLNRLISADRTAGTKQNRIYAYDDADNLIYNSGLCAGS
ncbi:MAG: hypothetical protein KDK75_06750, partial [Alphaproteobacteria bacterium]|nr:hypothetical protein [Alphaproteobacteria bacterium]